MRNGPAYNESDVSTVTDGRIIGHEGVGIIDEVGNSVSNFKKGDHVLYLAFILR